MERALLQRKLKARLRGKHDAMASNIVSLALGHPNAVAFFALQQACAGLPMAEIAQQYARNMDAAALQPACAGVPMADIAQQYARNMGAAALQPACAGVALKPSPACSEDTDALLVLQRVCAQTALLSTPSAGVAPKPSPACNEYTDALLVLQQACAQTLPPTTPSAGVAPEPSPACNEHTDTLLILQQACAQTAPPTTPSAGVAPEPSPALLSLQQACAQTALPSTRKQHDAALPAVNVSDCGTGDEALESEDSDTVPNRKHTQERSSDMKLVHASNAALARQHKARWGNAMTEIEHDMWLLLQRRSGDHVQKRFHLQNTIVKRYAFKAQKRAVLATLQYAFLAGMVDGAFALRPTEGFVGWLSFRVLQPRPFAALIDRVFAGIRRNSVDMVLRRCGFRMPSKRGFQHLHSGEEAVEFDPEQALRYGTTARPVTEFF